MYVGRLPYGTREDDIRRFFRGYGKLREINLKNGYGFVVSIGATSCKPKVLCSGGHFLLIIHLFSPSFDQEFDDPRDADDAVYDTNGKDMLGER